MYGKKQLTETAKQIDLSLIREFTPLELLVVVEIVGVLFSNAIPSFREHQNKEKYTEARLVLVKLYIAEKDVSMRYDNSCSFGREVASGTIEELNSSKYYQRGFP